MATRIPSRKRWRRSATTSTTSSTCPSGWTSGSCSRRSRSCSRGAAPPVAVTVAWRRASVGRPDVMRLRRTDSQGRDREHPQVDYRHATWEIPAPAGSILTLEGAWRENHAEESLEGLAARRQDHRACPVARHPHRGLLRRHRALRPRHSLRVETVGLARGAILALAAPYERIHGEPQLDEAAILRGSA